ncbi:hypothetical protein [Rhizobacter sp. LjRoot28]|uniref:hypothetical protein n=1 Tax=Rhizobacter sp. LjRoot28 TaxID=3342309 RepID=UPI003ECE9A56
MSQAEWFVVAAGNALMVAARRAGRWSPDTLKVLPVEPGSPPSLHAACDALVREWPADATWKGGVRVLVDDGWFAACRLPWSDALGRADEAEGFARAQFEAAGFGGQADDTVRIDDGPYRAPRRAVAYGAALLAALGRVAQAAGGPLRSVRPLSDAAWRHAGRQRHAPATAPLVVWLPGAVLVVQGGRTPVDVMARSLGPEEAASLRALWDRAGLRQPWLAEAAVVRGLRSGDAGPPWPIAVTDIALPDDQAVPPWLGLAAEASPSCLDAVAGAGRGSPLIVKAAAVVLLLLAVSFAKDAHDHWRLEQEIVGREQDDSSRRLAQERPPVGLAREELARVRSVNTAIRELNMPVAALIGALQVPKDLRVALLSVDVSGASALPDGGATLKVVAEARSGAEMSRYVALIANRPPIAQAYLTRHEVQQSNPAHPYRFTVEATWAP